MTARNITPPYPVFLDREGMPLDNGFVFIGVENLEPVTNPLPVYWDDALTIPAAQPIRTINGYPSRSGTPSVLFCDSNYSITVRDSKGLLVYSNLSNTDESNVLRADLASTATGKGPSLVGYKGNSTSSVARTVGLKLDDIIGFNDASPTADGTTSDASKLDTFLDEHTGKIIFVSKGTYGATGDVVVATSSGALKGDPGTTFKLLTSVASKVLLEFSAAVDGFVIEGITFDLNQLVAEAHTNIGVRVMGSKNITFRGCKFTNSAAIAFGNANRGYGVYLNGAFGTVRFMDCTFEKIMYAIVTEPSSTGTKITVDNCDFNNISGDGVEINVPTGSCSQINITNCRFNNLGSNDVGRGFGVGASGGAGGTIRALIVDNNQFSGVDNQAVHVEDGCRDVKIRGNSITGCGTAAATSFGCGIYAARGVVGTRTLNDVVIENNHVTSTTGTDYGIFCSGSYALDNLKIRGNTVNCAGAGLGILANSTVTNLDCDANVVRNALGVGIRCDALSGFLTNNICYDDQTVKTQTYGIQLQPDGRNLTIRGNKLTGNITNGFLLSSLTFPKILLSDELRLTALSAGAGAYSTWTDTIYLGVGANGQVSLDFMSGTDRSAAIYDVSWDGTTLTGTKISIHSSGNLSVSGTLSSAVQMNGNWLQTRVFNAGGAVSNITELAMFEGMILLK